MGAYSGIKIFYATVPLSTIWGFSDFEVLFEIFSLAVAQKVSLLNASVIDNMFNKISERLEHLSVKSYWATTLTGSTLR